MAQKSRFWATFAAGQGKCFKSKGGQHVQGKLPNRSRIQRHRRKFCGRLLLHQIGKTRDLKLANIPKPVILIGLRIDSAEGKFFTAVAIVRRKGVGTIGC